MKLCRNDSVAVLSALMGIGRGCLPLGLVVTVLGQGVTVLTEETVPAPLARFSVSGPTLPGAIFQVGFGFGTAEAPTPGELHDSLTLILAGFLDGRDRVLATIDVFGLLAKPFVEGAGDFSRTPVTFQNASLDPLSNFNLVTRSAYTMMFPLPDDWKGEGELTAFLASNGDPLKSVAFILNPVVIPEPGALGIAVAGGVALWLAARWPGKGTR